MLHLRRRVLSHILAAAPHPSTSHSSFSTVSSPRSRPPFPRTLSSPWRTTSSAPAASPEPRHSSHPPSSPTSSPPPSPTPSSPSSPASASPAPMSRPSSPGTRRSSAPKWRQPCPPSSLGSPASACHELRLRYFRLRSVVSNLEYYLPLFGSIDNLLRPLNYGSGFLGSRLERAVKPNVAFLRECGLGTRDIAKLFIQMPRIINTGPERLLAMVACAERIGVPRGSGMFRQALQAVACLSEEKIAAKVDYLKKMCRWSDTEVGIAVSKGPFLLRRSNDVLQRLPDFLISEVGLEPAYIAHRPAMLTYSLEGRLRPRYYVMRFLKENGLLNHDRNYYNMVMASEKVFVEKFVCPHKQAAPHLAEDYAAACIGEVPARFRSMNQE